MGDSRTDLGQKGFRSQDRTAGGKLGNPIGQPVVVQMGKLKPRVGKGFAQSHTESYAARTVVLLSDSWSRPISSTLHWPGRSLGWVFWSPTRSRGRRCKGHAGLCCKWCDVDQGGRVIHPRVTTGWCSAQCRRDGQYTFISQTV